MPLILPAPLWRRLGAALYDGLLLLALWLVLALGDTLLRHALGLPYHAASMRALLFLSGLGFCGWFWTHGGQTLGMRAWRLKLQGADGGAVRWPAAAARYAVAWIAWLALGIGVLWSLLDARNRAWQELASSTEMVLLPKPDASP